MSSCTTQTLETTSSLPLELLSSFLSNPFVFLLFLHLLSTFYDSNAAFGVQPPNFFHIIAEFPFHFLLLFPIWLHFEFPAWSNFGPTQRQHPHFYNIKVWRYHFHGEAKSSFSAWVTLQWLLFICSFGMEEFIEERLTKIVRQGCVMTHALMPRRCLRFCPQSSQVLSLALTLFFLRHSEQLSV